MEHNVRRLKESIPKTDPIIFKKNLIVFRTWRHFSSMLSEVRVSVPEVILLAE
jgi:hypothetical protein